MLRPVAVVTGSSAGIGRATVLKFAVHGFDVAVNFSRDAEPAEAVAAACREVGAGVEIVQADVSKDEDCRRFAEVVTQRWGMARILVNNAGRTKFVALKDFDSIDAADFQTIYGVNTIGAFQMARAFAPLLRKAAGASIVNVSSMAAVMGTGSSIAYMASKGALNTLTIALARALGPEIRVNGVAPGLIETGWLKNAVGNERFEIMRKIYSAQAALASTISAEDVAETIFALATAAPKTTGETLLVDAGYKITRG